MPNKTNKKKRFFVTYIGEKLISFSIFCFSSLSSAAVTLSLIFNDDSDDAINCSSVVVVVVVDGAVFSIETTSSKISDESTGVAVDVVVVVDADWNPSEFFDLILSCTI